MREMKNISKIFIGFDQIPYSTFEAIEIFLLALAPFFSISQNLFTI